MKERIAIIGLGYVGLPVALAFARKYPNTVGFDINCTRIDELKKGHDRNNETASSVLLDTGLQFSCDANDLATTTMYVIAVPTPVDENNVPDLTPLVKASEFVGKHIKPGAIVCYESTVYPGATEEVCGPVLEKVSGLKCGRRLQARVFARAHQPRRHRPHPRDHREGRRRPGHGHARARRGHVRRHRARGHPQGDVDQGRRGREGHREHAARHQHRPHERARGHLRPPRHPHHRRPRGGRHEVELPALPAGARRRSLHRRRPLLPDCQGAAGRLPARGHPRRPPHQQQRRSLPRHPR